jgi:fructose-1,6-bisphosphatase II / sedoheptulose-1,7-bisphosphatase
MFNIFNENEFLMHVIFATSKAAASASEYCGRGDKNYADGLAVEQMRKSLGQINSSGIVVIGEGEADEAPMLYFGEKLGLHSNATPDGQHIFEVAVDPLDGTTLCAKNMEGAVAVLALAPNGSVLHAPDIYMNKIAVSGRNLPKDLISLDSSIENNIKNIAKAKNKDISDLSFVVLDRERHKEIISKIRQTGARVNLIPDGDVMGVLSICNPFNKADGYFGIGGAPEGVITAAMLKVVGGTIHGQLVFANETEKQRSITMLAKSGINDPYKELTEDEMIKGEQCVFSSTAVTSSAIMQGVKKLSKNTYLTSTIAGSISGGYLFAKREVIL